MATDTVQIAPGLTIDADYFAGASIALLGQRGAGKSYTSRVITESLFDANVQTVVLDPMGVFWGLRAGAGGQARGGLPIPVFGGEHGDAPLESSAGQLMADLVTKEHLSMILDLSGFTSRTQERTFATAFLDRLYRTNRELVHLVVDEADLFAPQKPRSEGARLLVTMENIVRRGRNRGIGITMASQRAAVLNKDVLTQINGLVAMRVTAPQDRNAIRDWVRGQGDEQTFSEISPSLPQLADGESWWWFPEKNILKKVQVRKTRTFDSSKTKRRGTSARAPKTFAEVDLDSISKRIADTVERAKATDPKELAKKVRQLENALAARDTSPPAVTIVETQKVVPDEALVARLEAAVAQYRATQEAAQVRAGELVNELSRVIAEPETAAGEIAEALAAAAASLLPGSPTERNAPGHTRTEAAPAAHRVTKCDPVSAMPPPERVNGDASVTPARRRLLTGLASLEAFGIAAAKRAQLALWAGLSPNGGGYANNLSSLRSAGLIDYPEPGCVALTDTGRGEADVVEGAVTDAELHHRVQQLLSPAKWRIVSALIDVHPRALSREELAAAVDVSAAGGGFANNISALRTLGLIDYPQRGQVAATDMLFLTR